MKDIQDTSCVDVLTSASFEPEFTTYILVLALARREVKRVNNSYTIGRFFRSAFRRTVPDQPTDEGIVKSTEAFQVYSLKGPADHSHGSG